jgi:hypothetical protein
MRAGPPSAGLHRHSAARGVKEEHNTGMGGVRGFVGVTDNGWYRLLADRPDLLGEVNFWRPGGGGFRALRPGEPFFFKTRAAQPGRRRRVLRRGGAAARFGGLGPARPR